METKSCAVYVILGYDVNGAKDILGVWIRESEGNHYWMHIFDEIKARGVEDILFISMDGVSGLPIFSGIGKKFSRSTRAILAATILATIWC